MDHTSDPTSLNVETRIVEDHDQQVSGLLEVRSRTRPNWANRREPAAPDWRRLDAHVSQPGPLATHRAIEWGDRSGLARTG